MTERQQLELQFFKDLVQERVGLTFDATREEILRQKVSEVMVQKGYRSQAELYSALLHNDGVFLDFVNHLTINETYFFREPQYLQLLTSHLIPELLAAKRKGEKIKIISAGCSTGEEPYSIAMSLLERFGAETASRFAIVGFDLNSTALEKCGAGIYGNISFRTKEEHFRSKYFEPSRLGQLRLKSSVRDLVQFSRFNLLNVDYPELFRQADVIFYRNVSIYFDPPTQRKILTGLASIISPGGYLVFSSSETFSHRDIGALSLIENQGLFYFHKSKADMEPAAGGRGADHAFAPERRRPLPELKVERFAKKIPVATGMATRSAMAEGWAGRWARNPPGAGASPGLIAPEELLQEALICFRRKEHGRAALLAERLFDCECYRVKAYLLSGCILLNGQKNQEAGELFCKALEIDGLDLEAHMLLGLSAKNSGEPDKAIKCFHNALYVQNSCWMAHYFLAEMYLAVGNYPKALRCYGTLREILEKTADEKPLLTFFPIAFKRNDLLHLCRRKIASISGTSHGL